MLFRYVEGWGGKFADSAGMDNRYINYTKQKGIGTIELIALIGAVMLLCMFIAIITAILFGERGPLSCC